MSDPQVWLITGELSLFPAFGRRLVSIVLERGDRVTIQDFPQSPNLHLLELDERVDEAAKVWGRIDVLVNNAGADRMIRQFRPNVFALPYMRERKSGTVVIIGSRSAWRPELTWFKQRLFHGLGAYASSKAGLMGETLAAEARHEATPGNQPGDPMKAMKIRRRRRKRRGVAAGREWPLNAERDVRNKCMMMLKHLDEMAG
ncbi:hypothetical protein DFJ58DRAFT_822145, partial [Suillus subalutaceus]|uniref:uncharacterized protein n=1 Tax=Suillus subalutaceus TaxID=48586 RepID=UPI001B873E84